MSQWRMIAGLAALLLQAAGAAAAPEARIATNAGAVVGTIADGVASFKGIPFAAPPVGDLRWAAPQPVQSWSGERGADTYGPACVQKPGLSAENGGDPGRLSEDCLYLNVWTPDTRAVAKLPVIVWIHGGAYVFGAGGMPIYDGSPLAKRGAVFVSVNYRLGPLGFFAHPALEKGQSGGAKNFGLLDQVAALKWVQANIAAFGGDAGNVTIMGQSAGGKSVLAHFASPLSRGLFRRGVAMSVYILPDAKPDKARAVAVKVASAVGLDGAKASLAELRAVPAEHFGDIADKDAALGPVPIVGDAMLPRAIVDTFGNGKEAKLPLIIGNTSNDVSVLAGFGVDPEAVVKKLGVAGVALGALYPGLGRKETARQALRDIVFTMNTRWVADRHGKRGATWRYYFDYVPEKQRASHPDGVGHGADIPFLLDTAGVFEGTAGDLTEADRAIARKSADLLLAFARDGVPSARGVPDSQSDELLRDRTLVIGPDAITQQRNFMKVRLDVLMGVTRIVEKLFKRE
jgi:para-nitrobenzyl esterase